MKNSYFKKRRDRNVDVFRITDSCLISLFHEWVFNNHKQWSSCTEKRWESWRYIIPETMVVLLILKFLIKRYIAVTILFINPLLFLTSDFIIMNIFKLIFMQLWELILLRRLTEKTLLRHTINLNNVKKC